MKRFVGKRSEDGKHVVFWRIKSDGTEVLLGGIPAVREKVVLAVEAMLADAYRMGRYDKALEIRDALGIGVEP